MPFDGTHLNNLQQVFLKARKVIEERGWCQNSQEDNAGRVCVVGALLTVPLDYYGMWKEVEEAFIGVISLRGSHRTNISIEKWNDAKSRRKKHVLAAFDRAIIKAAGK